MTKLLDYLDDPARLKRSAWLVLLAYCFMLFIFPVVSGWFINALRSAAVMYIDPRPVARFVSSFSNLGISFIGAAIFFILGMGFRHTDEKYAAIICFLIVSLYIGLMVGLYFRVYFILRNASFYLLLLKLGLATYIFFLLIPVSSYQRLLKLSVFLFLSALTMLMQKHGYYIDYYLLDLDADGPGTMNLITNTVNVVTTVAFFYYVYCFMHELEGSVEVT